MNTTSREIHHITALASDPQRNVDFYTSVLGMHLVKKTVNFDEPGVYHLYYGDHVGSPGTLLTFFPFPNAGKGRVGNGQVSEVSLAIPRNALLYWVERLSQHDIRLKGPFEESGEESIAFEDPDGMKLRLSAREGTGTLRSHVDGPVPAEFAIIGACGFTMMVENPDKSLELLTNSFGFGVEREGNGAFTLRAHEGTTLKLLSSEDNIAPRMGAGSVHHIAWRVAGEQDQLSWRARLLQDGFAPTPVVDRMYFRSVYFREPGGVLFELATDGPGFLIDEEMQALGSALKLPAWMQGDRERIEARLPPLAFPRPAREVGQ